MVQGTIRSGDYEYFRGSARSLPYVQCFIDVDKLNLFKISLPWSKSVKLTVESPYNVSLLANTIPPLQKHHWLEVPVALVIRGLFICEFTYS
jgi:hypothetical protein